MNYPGPSGVDSDQRLVGTDAFREYVMRMTGTTGIKNFINKYKKRPSSNKMSDHLKNLSQVYLEQIAESGVGYEPGKPATKLGAVTGIPKADQMMLLSVLRKDCREESRS